MADYIQVTTTTGSKEEAHEIARGLVERKLAACVQVAGPITSVYRWKGKIETSQEWLCIIKSGMSLGERLEKAIREMHSYEEPEIIATPIVGGSQSYLKWLGEQIESRNTDKF